MTDALSSLWHRLRYTRLRDALRGRLDASLDWQGLISLAELPPELAAAVRQVVSRSRLWRPEKVDVAAELIAHFQDGLAAGRTPAELLQSFGDPQASAKLIRRAKRRGRPMLWHAWRYCWMGLATMLLLYVTAGLWMVTRHPTVKIDYLADFNKPAIAVPEDQRAWPLYRDALLSMGAAPTKEHADLLDPGCDRRQAGRHGLEKAGSIFDGTIRFVRKVARGSGSTEPRICGLDFPCRFLGERSRAVRRHGPEGGIRAIEIEDAWRTVGCSPRCCRNCSN